MTATSQTERRQLDDRFGARRRWRRKRISARELAGEFLTRIEKRNPELNAFLALSPERAYAQADRAGRAHRGRRECSLRWPDCRSP